MLRVYCFVLGFRCCWVKAFFAFDFLVVEGFGRLDDFVVEVAFLCGAAWWCLVHCPALRVVFVLRVVGLRHREVGEAFDALAFAAVCLVVGWGDSC